MDWAQIAATAAGILAPMLPYFVKAGDKAVEEFGKEFGESAWERGKALYELVRKKFAGDSYAEATLQRVGEKPEDDDRRAALATIIKEKAKDDDTFGRQLVELTQVAVQNQGIQEFVTIVYGGKVGKIITQTVGSIGTMNF